MNVTFPQTLQSFHSCITTKRPSLQRYYIQPFPSALLATKRHPTCFHELLLDTFGGKNDACSKSCKGDADLPCMIYSTKTNCSIISKPKVFLMISFINIM